MTRDRNPPIRFGLIGCGRVVQELHLPAWRMIPEASITAICDSDDAALRAVAARLPQARLYSSTDHFLEESSDLSFVVLATPGTSHGAIGGAVLARGLHLLVEKPLALDPVTGRHLYEVAEHSGVTLTCIHNYRFRENSRRALHIFRRGELGDIVAVNVRHRSGSLFAENSAWRRRERESRTLLFDSGVHLADIALLFLGAVDSLGFVDADLDSAGLQRVVFGTRHENGARGIFDFMIDASSSSTIIEILGEAGALELQFYPEGFRMLPARDTPLHRCLGEGMRLYDYAKAAFTDSVIGMVSHRAASHAHLFREFIAAVKNGHSNPVPPAEVLRVIELLDLVAARAYDSPDRDAPDETMDKDGSEKIGSPCPNC
jgi:UDP-N-acetyl-2-amino-2-deoxyglucuronate dehydrogenase